MEEMGDEGIRKGPDGGKWIIFTCNTLLKIQPGPRLLCIRKVTTA